MQRLIVGDWMVPPTDKTIAELSKMRQLRKLIIFEDSTFPRDVVQRMESELDLMVVVHPFHWRAIKSSASVAH